MLKTNVFVLKLRLRNSFYLFTKLEEKKVKYATRKVKTKSGNAFSVVQ